MFLIYDFCFSNTEQLKFNQCLFDNSCTKTHPMRMRMRSTYTSTACHFSTDNIQSFTNILQHSYLISMNNGNARAIPFDTDTSARGKSQCRRLVSRKYNKEKTTKGNRFYTERRDNEQILLLFRINYYRDL